MMRLPGALRYARPERIWDTITRASFSGSVCMHPKSTQLVRTLKMQFLKYLVRPRGSETRSRGSPFRAASAQSINICVFFLCVKFNFVKFQHREELREDHARRLLWQRLQDYLIIEAYLYLKVLISGS